MSSSSPTLVISVLTNHVAETLPGQAEALTPAELALQREIYFKVKTTTKMQKLIKAYLTRRGISLCKRDALCFLTPTNLVISDNDCPSALKLSEGDRLRCVFDRKNLP